MSARPPLLRRLPLVLLPALSGCKGDLGVTLPPQPPEAPPVEIAYPPAASPPEASLWPLLYAGPPTPVGQRARMLAWFAAVDLTEPQLRSFVTLARDARAVGDGGDDADHRYDPAYQAIVDLYARGRPSPADLDAQVAQLSAAAAGPDPRQSRYQRLYALLDRAEAWAAALPRAQAEKLASCRIFLAGSLGPLSTPGDYEDWAGTRWRGQDFGAFRAGAAPGPRRAMDIGGLWAEDVVGRDGGITARKLAVLVLLAAREPGVIEAAQVRLGERAPGDYTPLPP